jgi:hypothetical protein
MSEAKKKSPLAGAGCGALFALPFAGVGIGALGYLVYVLLQWSAMQAWVETPALILTADLNVIHSDDGSTHLAVATYEYEWEGRRYTGDRVGITGTSDNVGSWQEDKANELMRHIGQTFRCYVNPENPSESILYRDMRIAMIGFIALFAGIFSTVGFGLLWGVIWGARTSIDEARRAEEHPDLPWMQRADWAAGVIKCDTRVVAIALLVFGGLWMAISMPVLFFVPEAVADGEYMALIALIFPVIGVGLLGAAFIKLARWRKYGSSELHLTRTPGVIGGYIEGEVRVPRALELVTEVHATLKCEHSRTTGSGKNKSTTKTTVWETTQVLTPASDSLRFGAEAGRIPFRIFIPHGHPQSDLEKPDSGSHEWTLRLKAEVPGIDLDATFIVPVFYTLESSTSIADDVAAGTPAVPAPPVELDARYVRVEEGPGGSRVFLYPRARDLGGIASAILFAAIFGGVGIGMTYLEDGPPLAFCMVFAGVGALVFCIALWMLLHERRVEVRPGMLTMTRSLIFYRWTREIPEADIHLFEPHTGVVVNGVPRYDLRAMLNSGKTITVGTGIRSRPQAQRVIEMMIEAFMRGA